MNVYEVELATTRPGYRFEQHVRAASVEEAKVKVFKAQGIAARIIAVRVRRPCTEEEIAEELAKGAA